MKILGIGVDLVENRRIKLLLNNKKFLKRIFTKNEIKFSKKIKNKVNYFAKRYAAKEAFSKSLGIGIRLDLDFKKIEILNDKMNKPYYSNSKLIKNIIYKRFKIKRYNLLLSISDEKDYSIAFAILQKI